MNNNPETVSTDYEIADRLYFEPITLEHILNVVEAEQIDFVIVQFGGQTAINVAEGLEKAGVTLLGTSFDTLDALEDRDLFYQLLDELNLPHAKGDTAHSKRRSTGACCKHRVPCSYSSIICHWWNGHDRCSYRSSIGRTT